MMDIKETIKHLRQTMAENYAVFTYDRAKKSFLAEEDYTILEDDCIPTVIETEGQGIHYFIDQTANEFLHAWICNGNPGTDEVFVFAHTDVHPLMRRVIIHMFKSIDNSIKDSVLAVISKDPSVRHDFSFATYNRKTRRLDLAKTGGERKTHIVPCFTEDEIRGYYHSTEGMTLKEIADSCHWSIAKAKKIRLSILEKFNANNMAQAIKLNEIFNFMIDKG